MDEEKHGCCADGHWYMVHFKSISKVFLKLNSSHTLAYNPNAHRAYEKSQHDEDFGHIKMNVFLELAIVVTH